MVIMSTEEESKPAGRNWRGPAVIAGVILAVLFASAGAALLYRENLAQLVLRDRLEAQGLKNPQFRIDEFTTDAFSITAFSAGEALSFDRLTIGYSVDGLMDGRIAHIDLIGLRADLSQPGPWTNLEEAESDSPESPLLADPAGLPTLNIQQARLRLPGPGGMLNVTANATIDPDETGALVVSASASTDGPLGKLETGYEGTIQLETAKTAKATGLLKIRSNGLKTGHSAVKALKIDLPLIIDGGPDSLTVRFPENARLQAARTDLNSSHGTGPVSVSFTGQLMSTATAGGWFDATADIKIEAGAIRAGGVTAQAFMATLPMRIKARSNALNMTFGGKTRLSGGKLQPERNAPVMDLSAGLAGDVGFSWQQEAEADKSAFAVEHKIALTPSPVNIRGGPEHIQADLGKILSKGNLALNGAYTGRVILETAQLSRGDRSIAMANLEADLKSGPNLARPTARIVIGSVRDQSAATIAGGPIAGGYTLKADITQTPGGIGYTADIGGVGIKTLVTVSGLHDPTSQTGRATITLPDLTLGAAGLQPGSIIPALGNIEDVAGRIGGEARLIWTGKSIGGQAALRLDGVGGKMETGSIEGISGTLVFNNVWPPTTRLEQELRIGKIDAGAVLTETSVQFALLPSGILKISHAEADLAGGKVIVVAPSIDPADQSAEATVSFQGVQLAQLLNLVDLGDLKASGQLHGFVPVRIASGKIAINAGALASLGGGKLQFKSERARQVLKSGGEQVGLMLKALEDFNYERLGVDIDKSLAGNAQVRLRTLGHNPAVLRGRKFQINVNLETNLDRLLDAALEWYRLSGRALRDIVRPRARATSTRKDSRK